MINVRKISSKEELRRVREFGEGERRRVRDRKGRGKRFDKGRERGEREKKRMRSRKD